MSEYAPSSDQKHRYCHADQPSQENQYGSEVKPGFSEGPEQYDADSESAKIGYGGKICLSVFHFLSFRLLDDQLAAQHAHLALKAILA